MANPNTQDFKHLLLEYFIGQSKSHSQGVEKQALPCNEKNDKYPQEKEFESFCHALSHKVKRNVITLCTVALF